MTTKTTDGLVAAIEESVSHRWEVYGGDTRFLDGLADAIRGPLELRFDEDAELLRESRIEVGDYAKHCHRMVATLQRTGATESEVATMRATAICLETLHRRLTERLPKEDR